MLIESAAVVVARGETAMRVLDAACVGVLTKPLRRGIEDIGGVGRLKGTEDVQEAGTVASLVLEDVKIAKYLRARDRGRVGEDIGRLGQGGVIDDDICVRRRWCGVRLLVGWGQWRWGDTRAGRRATHCGKDEGEYEAGRHASCLVARKRRGTLAIWFRAAL